MAEERNEEFNCYVSNENDTDIVANINWKKWMCDWRGKMPSSFSGTWFVYDTPPELCPTMPRVPTPITLSRWKLGDASNSTWHAPSQSYREVIDTGDCGPQNYGFNYKYPIDYDGTGPEMPAFAMGIYDPLVPANLSLSLQARAVRISATQISELGPDVVMAASCSENSFYMLALFVSGSCKVQLEITGVAF
jgi:hypothetical protein